MLYAINDKPNKQTRFFCSKKCLGKYTGTHYGFPVHKKNYKYDYNQIKSLSKQGYTNKQIINITGMSINTFYSMNYL